MEAKLVGQVPGAHKAKRQYSTVRFPYYDQEDAVSVAKALHELGGEAGHDQLARKLGHKTVESGAYRLRLGGAAMFGLIETADRRVRLTDRAKSIFSMHPEDTRAAMIDAFLDVPLFRMIYERYQGRQLPPEDGLKNVIRELGVVPNQIDRVYSTLMRSADTAGYFSSGRGYLVAPVARRPARPDPAQKDFGLGTGEGKQASVEVKSGGSGSPSPPTGIHPALMGLLQELPGAGTPWRRGKREWLTAFTAIINVLYPDAGEEGVANS